MIRVVTNNDHWTDTSQVPEYTAWANRTVTSDGLRIEHEVCLCAPAQQSQIGESRELSGTGTIHAYRDAEFKGFLHYRLLRSPWADGSGDTLAVRVKEVKAFEPGVGIASALYTELRAAHPAFVVGADKQLTDEGRAVATHYREKHPDRHVGRFDTSYVLHRTSGAEDPLYESAHLTADGSDILGDETSDDWD